MQDNIADSEVQDSLMDSAGRIFISLYDKQMILYYKLCCSIEPCGYFLI